MSGASPPPEAEVVVIGGGVIGLSSAWRLAEAGHDVVVCDPGYDGDASSAAGGMLAPVTEITFGEEPLLELNLGSNARWPGFAADLEAAAGRPTGYRRGGTLLVARDRDDREALDDLGAYMRQVGVHVETVGSRAMRSLEPALAPTVRGGLHAPDDHRVDNRALVVALREACARTGVRSVAEEVRTLLRRGGRVRGVTLAGGREIDADVVVLAAGAWSAGIEGAPPQLAVIRPVKGEALVLESRSVPPLISRTVRGLDVYLVPRPDGRVVVGATMMERGFDTSVSAGAVLHLLREAYELLPGLTELDLVETRVGLRPGSPDNAPLIGRLDDELIVATGHNRNGILLTPITADAVVALVEGDALPSPADAFPPDRFERQEGAA